MTFDELVAAENVELGSGPWLEVTQRDIDLFAEATGDHQWIHVDPDRAAEGPFGRTIAHGYLTLSLLPRLLEGMVELDASMRVNYGTDKVRLTSPVPADSRVRATGTLLDARKKGEGVLYRTAVEVEVEGEERPALVATVLTLAFP